MPEFNLRKDDDKSPEEEVKAPEVSPEPTPASEPEAPPAPNKGY